MAARSSPTGWNDRAAEVEAMREAGVAPSYWACPMLGCAYTVRVWTDVEGYQPACQDHPEFLCQPWNGEARAKAQIRKQHPEPL